MQLQSPRADRVLALKRQKIPICTRVKSETTKLRSEKKDSNAAYEVGLYRRQRISSERVAAMRRSTQMHGQDTAVSPVACQPERGIGIAIPRPRLEPAERSSSISI
jgi:hypothetical protein